MPRFDYRCPVCRHTEEISHPRDAAPKIACPRGCASILVKVPAAPGVLYTCGGFYVTDNPDRPYTYSEFRS